jgi:nucleoside-diphosphate-sugar epimerase
MVVGNGLMAKAFARYADDSATIVFASGVSNSQEVSPAAFAREADLLERVVTGAAARSRLVYFGTCSVTDPALEASDYVRHKLRIEAWIGTHVANFTVVRLPNIVGGPGNPRLLVNYLFDCIAQGRPFSIWQHARRNLLGVDDACVMVDHVLRHGQARNRTVAIANPHFAEVLDLVRAIERHMGKTAHYDVQPGGGTPEIDTALSREIAAKAGVAFGDGYLERLLQRYYPRS